MTRIVWMTFAWLLLTGCNLVQAVAPPPPTRVQPLSVAQVQITPIPSVTRELQSIPTRTPTATPISPAPPIYDCTTEDTLARTQHVVQADVNYSQKQVAVQQTIHYTNNNQSTLSDIVLNIEANNWEGSFSLVSVTVNRREASYELIGNRLTIPLPAPLEPACEANIVLDFDIHIPEIRDGITSYRGFFGYSERQTNLGHWLATVAVRQGDEWIVHDSIGIGEQIVLEQADWDVTLNVSGTSDSLVVAAPGVIEQIGETSWRIIHQRSRDFAISMSEHFQVTSRPAPGGINVELYSFGDTIIETDDGQQANGAEHALQEATRSLTMYQELYGRYPYDRMLIVQGDFPDGMEFSGLVFVSTAWFYYFDGTLQNYLTIITVHEISHQWWYALVGNDSALTPWLDEALATYSEYLYFEKYYPELKNWWWSFRVANFYPQGQVDQNVYEFATAREYINATYLRGAQMLHNLREDLGDEAFFDLLAKYAAAGDGQIATPEMFWSLLSPGQLEASIQTRADFFRDPNIVPIPNVPDASGCLPGALCDD